MTSPDITNIMRTVVADLSAAMGYTVHFQHGHMLEIANVVKQLAADQDIDKRYPLIALQQDIKVKEEPYIGVSAEFKLYIITLSNPDYVAQQRIDNIFEPYLRPIYEELMYQIANSGYFDQGTIEEVKGKCTKIDRLFWGKEGIMGNDANIFGDWVDCIELDFSGLVAYASCEEATVKPKLLSGTAVDENNIILVWNTEMGEPTANEIQISILNYTDLADAVTMSADGKTMKVYQGFDEFESEMDITLLAMSGVFQSASGIDADAVNFVITNMI